MAIGQSTEILRLRAMVRDLLALSTMPDAWVGREPHAIARDFANLLIGSLELDFAFVRLCNPTGCQALEVIQGDCWKGFPEWLQQRLATFGKFSRTEIVANVGGDDQSCSGIVIPIGVNSERGIVAAASNRSSFPDQIDQQLLSAAANNAATAFQNAFLINDLRCAQEALRNREQELRKAGDELEIKVAERTSELAHINRVSTLGEMAASLAHEIKQPISAAITSAKCCIEWLAHEPPNLDRARAAAARIDNYGNRATEIINRIRSLYKKSPPQRELIDVDRIIQEMLTLLKGEANQYSVAMRAELSTDLPKIMADRVQLQQVFMNLMLNGIEAMKNSGGELTVKSQLLDSQLQFSVSDTGLGLPAEKADEIFNAFFTTKPQGSGMGLAISRSIVESHGGRLWATPNVGCGATFHFSLPRADEATEAPVSKANQIRSREFDSVSEL